jgi:hypothetical protein
VFNRPNLLAKGREMHINAPSDHVPVSSDLAKLKWLRRLVGVRQRNSNGRNLGISERKDDVTRRDLLHELIERIQPAVPVLLRRPQISAWHLVSKGLILVDPPIPHALSDKRYRVANAVSDIELACGQIQFLEKNPIALFCVLENGPKRKNFAIAVPVAQVAIKALLVR